jgi:hypothetical protein
MAARRQVGNKPRGRHWTARFHVGRFDRSGEKEAPKTCAFYRDRAGLIEEGGSIDRGAQNLPGNWESSKFNLPSALYEKIPSIGEHETSIVLHNDAVVQGLSEIPFMQDISRWGCSPSERDSEMPGSQIGKNEVCGGGLQWIFDVS